MREIATISKITLKECLRARIFIGLLVFLLLFLIFSIYISTLSLGTTARFIENTGMLGISMISLMVVILFGLFFLYQEKERNEHYVLLSRTPRTIHLLGRFAGTVYVLIIFNLAAGFGIFCLTWFFGNKMAPELFYAVYWATLEYSLLTAIGLLFYAMGIGFTLNALLLISVYIVGHSVTEAIQSFAALGQLGSPLHLKLVQTVSYLFPNFDFFDFRLAIVHSETISTGNILLASAYWFSYLVAVLSLSSMIIGKRDI